MHIVRSLDELLKEARAAESNGQQEEAVKIYMQAIRQEPHQETAYNRLMVIHRKARNYEEEWKIINKGIRAFEEFFEERAEKIVSKTSRAARISTTLAKALGLKDKKGKDVIDREPLASWKKRGEVVKEKLAKADQPKAKATKKKAVVTARKKK